MLDWRAKLARAKEVGYLHGGDANTHTEYVLYCLERNAPVIRIVLSDEWTRARVTIATTRMGKLQLEYRAAIMPIVAAFVKCGVETWRVPRDRAEEVARQLWKMWLDLSTSS